MKKRFKNIPVIRAGRDHFSRNGILCVFLLIMIIFTFSLGLMPPDGNTSTYEYGMTDEEKIKETEESGDFGYILASRETTLLVKGEKKIKEIKDTADYSTRARLDVPMLIQFPELPTGCESVALTILFQDLGEDIEKELIAREYLIYSDTDLNEGFLGDPFSEVGAGIYSHGLTGTAWFYIHDNKRPYSAVDLGGESFETLLKVIDAGIPVAVWTTSGYVDFMGYDHGFYLEEHCVVMCGYDLDEDKVYLSDPQIGYSECSLKRFRKLYNQIGRYAMTVFNVEG